MKSFLARVWGRFVAPLAIAALVVAGGAVGGAAAYQANTLNFMQQGGAIWDIGGTLQVDPGGVLTADKGSVTANSGNSYAVTANNMGVLVTTDSLSTAAGSSRAITITDSKVTTSSLIDANWAGGTDTTGTPIIKAVPGSGSITLTILNNHASAAFNGTFIIHVLVL